MFRATLVSLNQTTRHMLRILLVYDAVFPVKEYGGTERVVYSLGKALVQLGHQVTFLARAGSQFPFAQVIAIDPDRKISQQIPEDIDLVHFHLFLEPGEVVHKPHLTTVHGHIEQEHTFDINTVFVSRSHAQLYGCTSYVHNGMAWDDLPAPNLKGKRDAFHFLGKASWKVKNLKGAIDVIRHTKKEKLDILGGTRYSERLLKMGPHYFFHPRLRFKGMVGSPEKEQLLQQSKGLVFPILWLEPFGMAIIESLYHGCPVFGTPYGSLPELVVPDVGFLSTSRSVLTTAVEQAGSYDRTRCHEYARDTFGGRTLARAYLKKYELVLNGKTLSPTPPRATGKKATAILPFNP